jgi:hypothetical protein
VEAARRQFVRLNALSTSLRYPVPSEYSKSALSALCQITKMLGCADQEFIDIRAMALKAPISGSILAEPDACLVMIMALPFGPTRALASV